MPADDSAAICAAETCASLASRRDLCAKHDGHKRYGTPLERFARKFRTDGDCLVWRTHLNPDGYGLFYADGKLHSAHRWIWEQKRGPIPEGMQIDHTCWKPACVNVDHLRVASPGENSAYRSGPSAANKSTGVRNVYPNGGGYVVLIRKDGDLLNFGTHRDIADAARIAVAERARLFGSYAGR